MLNLQVLLLLNFGSCPNCMSSASLVAEIQFKILNERALSTGEPCTCEYVTMLFNMFSCEFSKNFQNSFSTEYLWEAASDY